MKKIFILIILMYYFCMPSNANIINGIFKTSDNIDIAYNLYQTNHDSVLIIAHGWFMSKDSKAFSKLSNDFSKYYDIIILDFRGHSKSSGKYTFGSKEVKDLIPVINYAKKNYKHIYLMGFSLGSLISVDYCSKYHDVDKLILVSAPTDFQKIENHVWNKNAFLPTLKKFEFKRWISIRFASLNLPKILPTREIKKIEIPVFFIGGEKDPIIFSWHNEELYQNSPSKDKKELLIKDGKHAEDLYLENPKYFINTCVEWLNKD